MRIDKAIGSISDRVLDQSKINDPFDLSLKIIELKNEHKGMAPAPSGIGCLTVAGKDCPTGTGNSFCCTCR